MAINLSPIPELAFSGAPYLITGSSTCTSVSHSSHHRVTLKVTVYINTFRTTPRTEEREYVYMLNPSAPTFSFNLSELLQSIYRRYRVFNYNYDTNEPADVYIKLQMSFVLREEYVVDGEVQHPDTDVIYPATPYLDKPSVIDGHPTDFERIINPEWQDIKSYTDENKLPLTKRPTTGSVFFLHNTYRLTYFTNGQMQRSVAPTKVGPYHDLLTQRSMRVIEKPTDIMRRFLFLNSFGIIEDALVFAEVKKTIGIKSSVMESMRENTFSGQRTLYSRATPGDTEIELSSGPVNEEWAEWWVTEVLRSERAWLYDEKRNYWMEGVIVPAEKHTIIDRSKSQASVVPFTFRCTMQS